MSSTMQRLLLVWALCCLWGCGKQEPEKAAAPGSAPLPPPKPMVAPKPVAKPATAPQIAKPQTKKPTQEPLEEITARDFSVKAEMQNFVAIAPAVAAKQHEFFVFQPDDASSATAFAVVPPEVTAPAPTPQLTIELPKGLEAIPRYGVTDQGLPRRIRHIAIDYELILVPAGVFIRGSDDGPANAQPAHPIYLSNYYIGVTEVTLSQYQTFREQAGEAKTRFATPPEPINENADGQTAVVGIAWRDALNFVESYGLALPTEAQWEKAARGDQGFTYPWGHGRPVWERPRQLGNIGVPQQFQSDRSPYGVCDMAGNAREWTNDWYAAAAYEDRRETDGTPLRDPTGPKRPDETSHRVIKGGKSGWELWRRNSAPMKERISDVGFRCVWNPPQQPNP